MADEQKYWGLSNVNTGKWASDQNGHLVFYPSVAIAQAHAKQVNDLLAEKNSRRDPGSKQSKMYKEKEFILLAEGE